MNISLSKLSWKAQLGVVAALSLAGVGAFWNIHVVPTQAALDGQKAQLQSLQAEVARGTQIARRLPEFRREVGGLEEQLGRLRAVLPEEKDVADLLRRIQAMATESNLTIRGFTPQAIANKQMYAEWPIGLQIEGSYHNLGGFLERISKFPRIINVTAIKIKTKEKQTDSNTIAAECTATTFVMTEPKAPTGAAPAPAASAKTE